MKIIFSVQLVLVIISLHCFAQNQIKFSALSVKEDLKYLYETLDKSH
jgi:hypothetical protein